jgi:Animal haem peroxidase
MCPPITLLIKAISQERSEAVGTTMRRGRMRRSVFAALAALAVVGAVATANQAQAEDGGVSDAPILGTWEVQSLNGINNNPNVPNAGAAGIQYLRIAPARYADGRSQPVSGPDPRTVSNRIFNDTNVNVFSERGVTQWGNVWGQFIDHNVGLRDDNGTTANLPFNANDPLEDFTNTLGVIPFKRSAAAPGTGVSNIRQHINTETSFIDAEAVYGKTDVRLDWLREGTVDGNPDNNGARMLMPNNYLPHAGARGNASTAPTMQVDGRLLSNPARAVEAGDIRANEQMLLTAVQTLFAREHNRIVAALPSTLSQYDKFQLARAVVIAEIQHITYTEFLPAIGVPLPAYQGYNVNLNPATSHEFASVGYRAHSFIHGEMETTTNLSRYSSTTLNAMRAQGVEVTVDGTSVDIAVPDNVLFFNPDLLEQIQLGPVMTGVTAESDYRNDEMIDNQLRSVLFRIPSSTNPDCLDGDTLPQCFNGVVDLGAIDVQRGRDHGMPSYNTVRNAYGLASKTTFTSITGESTETLPAGLTVNSPQCQDIIALFDINGNPTTIAADNATRVVKRCSLAARLKAIYGSTSNLDAFVGMMAEKHVSGSELGELQRAIWQDQFQAARDGDRFFYLNDPLQTFIRNNYGIDSRRTLRQVILSNTDAPSTELPTNVFRIPGAPNIGVGSVSTADATADASSTDTTAVPSARKTGSSTALTPSDLVRHQGKGGTASTSGIDNNTTPAVPVGWTIGQKAARRRRPDGADE